MKYNWLWFDLDNTLMDFDKGAVMSFEKTMTHFGIPYSTQLFKDYRVISEACWDELEKGIITIDELKKLRFERFLKFLGSSENPMAVNAMYLKTLSEIVIFYEGAFELLQELKRENYKLGLITNGLKEVQRPKLKRANLLDTFEVISISGEIGFAKPDFHFFDYTYQKIGNINKEEILVIGDNINSDIKGGNEFGVKTCWCNFSEKENNTTINPTYTISNLHQIRAILKG